MKSIRTIYFPKKHCHHQVGVPLLTVSLSVPQLLFVMRSRAGCFPFCQLTVEYNGEEPAIEPVELVLYRDVLTIHHFFCLAVQKSQLKLRLPCQCHGERIKERTAGTKRASLQRKGVSTEYKERHSKERALLLPFRFVVRCFLF